MKYDEAMAAASKDYLEKLLIETGGNMSQAARISGLNRTGLYKTLRRAGVPLPERPGLRWGRFCDMPKPKHIVNAS